MNDEEKVFEAKQELLNETFKEIFVSHEKRLEVSNNEMGVMKERMGVVETKVIFIVKQNWIIIAAIVGAVITIIFNK